MLTPRRMQTNDSGDGGCPEWNIRARGSIVGGELDGAIELTVVKAAVTTVKHNLSNRGDDRTAGGMATACMNNNLTVVGIFLPSEGERNFCGTENFKIGGVAKGKSTFVQE